MALSSAYSQKDYSYVYQSDSIVKQGLTYHSNENYSAAVKEYDRIAKTDPKYLQAQYEKALTLLTAGKKDELLAHLEKFRDRMPEIPLMYIIYGSYLSDEKKYDESEKMFKEGEKFLGNSSTFYYNLGILYVRMEQRQKGIDALEKAISINPNYASAHYFVGLLALEDGQVSQGTIALMSYLILSPNGKFAENAILKMNEKYGENFLSKPSLKLSNSGDDFSELDEILRNQLALKKTYKLKSTIDDVVIRQMQAVAEYASTHKSGNGFFETNYLPWIKSVYDKNLFEGFSYYSLLSMEEKLGKKLTSQKKKLTAFYNAFINEEFWQIYGKRKMDIFGQQKNAVVYLNNGEPYYMGEVINGKKEGKFKVVNSTGNATAEINYKNDELDGLQKYYDEKGNLIEEKSFVNGKLEGVRKEYYTNKMIGLVENYKNDKLEGISTSYNVNGGKNCELSYTNGEANGTLICLYPNGTKKSELNYKNGKLDGISTYYNVVGDITSQYEFKDDERSGKSLQYFDGKVMKSEGEYANGKGVGTHKSYHSNGAVESEMYFTAGKLNKKTTYSANSKKYSDENYDSNEILELAAYYDEDGNKYFEEKHKNGEYKSGIQYGKQIAKPIEIAASKKKFIMNNFDGKLLIDGMMDKGRNIGEWNYRYSSGEIRQKRNYTLGAQNGIATQYERDGSLTNIVNYKDNQLNGVYEGYSYGKHRVTSNYIDDMREGPYQNFFPDGSLLSEGFSVNDQTSGMFLNYWRNQNISINQNFIEDELTAVEYFDSDGKSEAKLDFANLNGPIVVKLRGGTIIENRNYVNGKLQGKYTIVDKSGDLQAELNFVNDTKHGMNKFYAPSGKISYEGNYYAGNYHGQNKWYDLAGNLRMITDYVFGEETGKTVRYYHNKNKMWDYTEFNGLKDGEFNYYNPSGTVVLVINYKNNAPVSYKALAKDGKIGESVAIVNENVSIISKYPNDKTAIQLQLNNGEIDGKIAVYTSEGNVGFEGVYRKGLLHGDRTEYYANGKIYKKEIFKDGDYNGKSEYFKEDGKPWLVANYSLDQYHGDFLIFTNGTLSKTKKYDSDELVSISK